MWLGQAMWLDERLQKTIMGK